MEGERQRGRETGGEGGREGSGMLIVLHDPMIPHVFS